jgi:hypothetical protein
MTGSKPVVLVGLIRLREHCASTWEEPERGGRRMARVTSTHCAECVEGLSRLGYLLTRQGSADGGPVPEP